MKIKIAVYDTVEILLNKNGCCKNLWIFTLLFYKEVQMNLKKLCGTYSAAVKSVLLVAPWGGSSSIYRYLKCQQ